MQNIELKVFLDMFRLLWDPLEDSWKSLDPCLGNIPKEFTSYIRREEKKSFINQWPHEARG